MFNDRICQFHNLPSMAIDLKAFKEAKESLLCAKCLTDQSNSDEVAHFYDIQLTIDDIVQLQISKQKQFTNHLISQMEELKNNLYQFQQFANIIINKQIKNIEQDQKELTQKLNHLENQGNVRNDQFYLEFLKKNYKGKYVLQCSNKFDIKNSNLMKNIKEGLEQIFKSDSKIKIQESLNQIINECNQEEIITKKITQKINQKQKTITLSQDCPNHEQEITMIILDKKSDRNRLICIDCIEDCQQQGLKQLYSIKKVNQIWKDSKGKLSQSLNEILSKSQQNVRKAQEILQQQNNKFNESTEQLQLQIGQSFIEIKNKQQQVDEEKHINLQELESEELLNKITFIADGQCETEFIQMQSLKEKEQKQFIEKIKEYSTVLQQLKNEYDQQILTEYGINKIDEQKKSEQVLAEKENILDYFKTSETNEKQLIQQEKEQIQQNIEIKFQKQNTEIKGFMYIDDLVEKISQNEQELQKIKGNKELIQEQFDQVWSKILSEAKEQQEQVFQDYSQASYKAIYSSFTQYQYNSQNSEQFIKFFQQMSQTPPIQQNYNEKQTIFNIYIQEIQSQQQFQIIFNNNQNIKYYDIFCQPLSDRLKRSDYNYVVDLNNFYQQKSSFYQIPLKDFKEYLLSDLFYNDFNKFKNKKESNHQNSQMNKEKMINQILSEFLCVLDYCQINYNKKKFDELKKYLTEGNQWYQFEDKTKSLFNDFQKTFALITIFNQQIMQPEYTRNISNYYPSLKLKQIDFCYNNSQEYQKEIENQNQNVLFLLSSKFEPKQQYQSKTFSYIADQKANSNLLQQFNSQIVKQFQEIMIKQEGWQKIYSEIYDIIKSKMIILKNNNKQIESDSENEETITSDMYLVKQIMAIIEQKILEYNIQFANFGIILSSIGESLIYYYSIFVIWRFSCYNKWKQLDANLQKLHLMKDEQLNRFIIAIEQNTTEQSISNAQVLAKSIKPGFLDRFYSDHINKVQQSIDQIEQKSSDYVRILDQRLLENYEKAKQNKIEDQEILDYILDQKRYIEKSVDKLIKEKEEELQKEYEQKLRQDLNLFLEQVFHNISIIYDITRQQSVVLKSEDYFQINDDDYKKQDYKKEDYDNKLFLLICKCIQGEKLIKEQLQSISRDQILIFNQNYVSIKSPIFVKMLNDSEKRIPLLKPFIQELHKLIEEEIQNSAKQPLVLSNLQVQGSLNKVKLSLVGCLYCCPMCKRKCDQQCDSNHQHSCSNGHQLRGMNGVLINNKPSLFTCEEIEDNSLISTSDSTIQKKWSDVKKAYPEWNFKHLNDQKVTELKKKMMNIWNSGIGQLVCQQLSQKLNITIQFFQKNDFYQDYSQSIHYILMLDDSGSMSGEKWKNAKYGALQCMQEIAKNGEAKVSVIIFNSDARVVIDCESVNINKQQDLISFQNGGTCFNKAFLQAHDQLQKHVNKKFDKNIILFYTDGGDQYPADAVNKFCYLPQNIKQTLQLVSCAEGKLNQIASLKLLTDQFNKSGISAELKSNINVKSLQKVWSEVVNQDYHNIKF